MPVVGVAWNGSLTSMQAFEDRHDLTFPSAVDDDGALFARFEVLSQPAWAFVSTDGTVQTHRGVLERAELEQRLAALSAG